MTMNKAFPISRRKLEDTLIVWDSITTTDGALGGTSLIDSTLDRSERLYHLPGNRPDSGRGG